MVGEKILIPASRHWFDLSDVHSFFHWYFLIFFVSQSLNLFEITASHAPRKASSLSSQSSSDGKLCCLPENCIKYHDASSKRNISFVGSFAARNYCVVNSFFSKDINFLMSFLKFLHHIVSAKIPFILLDIDSIFLTLINFFLLVFFHFVPSSYLVVQFVIREYSVFCSESLLFIELLFIRWKYLIEES